MYGLYVHVWSRRGGVTPHSEIIMGIEGLVQVHTPFRNHGVRLRLLYSPRGLVLAPNFILGHDPPLDLLFVERAVTRYSEIIV